MCFVSLLALIGVVILSRHVNPTLLTIPVAIAAGLFGWWFIKAITGSLYGFPSKWR